MKKYAKIIDERTKQCEVGLGTNSVFYSSIGMTEQEVEQAYNGCWYLKGYAPTPTIEEQNESIRQARQSEYEKTSDILFRDYQEALARGDSNAEQLKQDWLASKDKVRADNPYIGETK